MDVDLLKTVVVEVVVNVVVGIVVVVVVDMGVVVVAQISPDEPWNMKKSPAVELSHALPHKLCANDDAP